MKSTPFACSLNSPSADYARESTGNRKIGKSRKERSVRVSMKIESFLEEHGTGPPT